MNKHLAAMMAAVLLVPAVITTAGAAGDKERIFGATRIETSVEVSRVSFPDAADVVYLARSDLFVDALAAGALVDGPVLLVPSCGDLPPAITNRVDDLDPSRVLALGGPGAICDAVVERAAGGRPTGRLAGGSRYDTAVEISKRAFPDGADVVYVASGADTAPDAVAGGVLTDGPILLLPPGREGSVPTSVLAEISRLQPTRVYALGGTVAVTQTRLNEASGSAPGLRVAGGTRYETAVRIGERQFPSTAPVVTAYLAQGEVFADAVAAGSLTDGPILLVPQCGDVPSEVVAYLREAQPSQVVALGGQVAICDELLEAASQFTGNVDFIRMDVNGPELRLDATQPYVLVTDAPQGQVSLVFHDFSRGFSGQVLVETFDQDNDQVLRGMLKDSDATNTVISNAPGRYVTRLTPSDVEPGAQIRAVATKWASPNLQPDTETRVHHPDRFGSGLDIPVPVSGTRSWQWMSGTAVNNVVDVYTDHADLQVRFPDGALTQKERFKTDENVSLRWPVHAPGDYRLFLDPRENRIRTTLSTDTWETGTTSLDSPAYTFTPRRAGDGGTWRYRPPLRRWHSIVGYEEGPLNSCAFEVAVIDRTNEQLEEDACDVRGVASIAVEPLYAGDHAALAHTLNTQPLHVEVTPWAIRDLVIGQDTTASVTAGDLRGRGGVINFDGEVSQSVVVRVDHPGAQWRPDIKLERPSGVFLDPPRRPTRDADFWEATFELPEHGEYSILVDTLGYPTDFEVTVEPAPDNP